ncbi:MAG: dephospho-CoA kinase [Longimicrobiales bacterium]|nr:dephospho-CoA kinase [Longimicrobiales bacterium]
MLKVALTGNVGSGKSTVAAIWSDAGVPVVRADDLAREVVVPGSDGLARVVKEFGGEVVQKDGSLDRTALRTRVFRDPGERARLEGILHPLIRSLRDDWIAHHEARMTALVVAEIPLLFEVGLEKEYDAVVLVVAPHGERLRRLMADRGLAEEEASRVMAAQIPNQDKLELADYVLENGGSREDLEIRCLALLDLLRARARRSGNQ